MVDKCPTSPDHTTLEKPYDIKMRSDYLSALPKCHTPPSTPSAPVKFDGLKTFRYVSFSILSQFSTKNIDYPFEFIGKNTSNSTILDRPIKHRHDPFQDTCALRSIHLSSQERS